ncbi:MAG: ABC transporter ATP-binding protein [Chromatiaceae bacterium]|nr:ABC transporter ATP-binding protein [Chromatiaceae bacterium]MCP5315401.1 ABC transporter ATP-binding protein [Chromatiaceae bacterium]
MTRVSLEGVSKAYRVYRRPQDRLRDLFFGSESFHPHWALRDVDLVLDEGDSLGVIGNNGAGKSTLMKLVSGVLAPSYGKIAVDGRVTAILELGTGFHPEFTGRENIFYSAEVLGIPHRFIKSRLKDILSFAELGSAIDEPVKTYSTGMIMRLGFSLVTSVDPDVLIVDEALAVGDHRFKQKCIGRLAEIKENGATIIFCSHSMHHVTQFCNKALWLENGSVMAVGPARVIVDRYIAANSVSEQQGVPVRSKSPRRAAAVGPRCTVKDVTLSPTDISPIIVRGTLMHVVIDFSIRVAGSYVFGVAIDRAQTGQRLVAETALECGLPALTFVPGDYRVVLGVGTDALRAGGYEVKAGLLDKTLLQIEDYRVLEIEVVDSDSIRSPALIRVPIDWDVEKRFYG